METRTRPVPSRALFERVDPASLVAFRIAFGILMVVLVARYFIHGWIEEQYYRPTYFFTWPGLSWIRPWPRPWMEIHFAALGGLGLCVALGLFYRWSAALLFVGFTYVHLIDQTNYLNHYYLLSLVSLLLACMPLGRSCSMDVASGRSRPATGFPAWTLWILRFQVAVVYFFAGVAKLQPDWLLRAQPLRLWLSRAHDVPGIGPLLGETWVAYLFSWAGAAFDLAIPFLLLGRRTRFPAFLALVAFHAMTAVLFPIGLFPWIMILLSLVFLPPDWPRRIFRTRSAALETEPAPRSRRTLVALTAYVLLQLAIPLRHWVLPGDVLWTEEGFRFSWRVMLIEKTAQARFVAREPRTGREVEVRPEDSLTPAQVHFMSTQPDMIRAFARKVRRDRGDAWEVRGDVHASLNARPSAPLVDPRADLSGPE